MRKILIADDSTACRAALKGYIPDEFEVIEAENGREAISLMYKEHKSLAAILLDIDMPVMDGYVTLKMRSTNPILANIPVFVITTSADEKTKEKALALGADDVIVKPIDGKSIAKVLIYRLKNDKSCNGQERSTLDRLTGVFRREVFMTKAAAMIKSHDVGYYILSCVNIDNFKIINDLYGTDMGDRLLRYVASCFNNGMEAVDGICGRNSADEFLALYPASAEDSEQVMGAFQGAISPDFLSQRIRIRIGRYRVTDKLPSMNVLYDRAKIASDSIRGDFERSVAEYTNLMREELVREQYVVSGLPDALKNGEFEPWFQPQYNHATGAMIGSEALVRWRRDGRFISPAEFIPVLERTGLIYEMDQNIWEQVCRLLRKWIDEGLSPLPVSVNISRRDIFHKHFIQILTDIVKKYNIPTDLLRLEVTESAFSESTKMIVEKVNELIMLGFTVEIDDFGSGYSSLNTLKDVPASILKLDMKFFENTENNQRSGNIIESVVRMAKWIGMAVIAEGVEEKAQADYLKTIGCYYIQGYLYSKPLPAEEYVKKMAESSKEAKLTRLQTLDTLNNNEFWNPKSMETFIFNSYAGAACILEYSAGKIEMLRASDYYVNMLGSALMRAKDLLGLDWVSHMDPDSLRRFDDDVRESLETKQSVVGVYRFVNVPGCPETVYLRCNLRVIATVGERIMVYVLNDNITQQKIDEQMRDKAEKKVEESAKKLNAIMNNVNGSVCAFTMDDAGNADLILGNDNYYAIFGYTRAEAEERNLDVMSCIIPDDFDLVVSKLNQLKIDKKPVIIDYRAQKKDGSLAYIRTNASVMSLDGYGDSVIVSVETDNTGYMTLQDQLRIIVDNINGGVSAVFIKGDRLEYAFANDKYYEILGYTREQYNEEVSDIIDLIDPRDRIRTKKMFREAIETQRPYSMEFRITRRNGAVRHILCNTTFLHLFGIKEPVQLGVTNDITQLREAQEKEHELSEQIQSIMSNINGGITSTIFREDGTIDLAYSNDGFYQLYGYTKEQWDAEVPDVLDLVLPEDREKTMETVARIVRERGSETYEYRCRKRDGSVMWTQATNSVIGGDSTGGTRLLAITMDVTAMRTAELEKEASADRLRAIAGSMTNGMSAVAFRGEKTDFIFANERYYEIHGITKEDYDQVYLADSLPLVYPEDRERFENTVVHTLTVGQKTELEYRIIRPDKAIRWLRASINAVSIIGIDVPVQVTVFTDITEEKEATDQLRFVNSSAHDILTQTDIGFAIHKTLQNLCAYFEGDRASVFELNTADNTSDNTYEFCADGVQSGKTLLQSCPSSMMNFWYEAFEKGECVAISDVNSIGDGQADLRELLQKTNVQSLIVVPLRRDAREIGFVIIGNPRRYVDKIRRLTALSDYISVMLFRRDLLAKIEEDTETYRQLLQDIPGGYVYLRADSPEHITTLNFNDNFCTMRGMTREDVLAMEHDNALSSVHPDDVPELIKHIRKANDTGKTAEAIYRLRCKDGTYKWFHAFGRPKHARDGKLYINAYYTDYSTQKSVEEEQISLLDNLPTGAALYQYEKKKLTVIHLNKSYWRLVERDAADPANIVVTGAIHPDDVPLLGQEVDAAIRQKRNIEINLRVRYRKDEYKPFHISATVSKVGREKYYFYASYTPISDEAVTFQEFLPIALSTVMTKSDDISYVKDRNLRYICCSESIKKMAGCASARDFIGKTAMDMFEHKYADRFTKDDAEIIATGKPIVGALEYIPLSGSVSVTSTSKYPILDAHGKVMGVYCISRDITAQKEKESQLELLASSIPGGLATYTLSEGTLKLAYFNDGYYAFSGVTREEYTAITAENPLAFVVEEDKNIIREAVAKLGIENGGITSCECAYRCRAKDGSIKSIESKAVVVSDENGALILNVLHIDVTERRKLEEKKNELLDKLPCGAAMYRFDGHTLTAVHINEQYKSMVGRDDNSGNTEKKPMDYIHPDDRKLVYDAIIEAILAGRNGICDLRLLCGTGEYRMFHLDARIEVQKDKTYLLYVAYTLVTKQNLSLRKSLPDLFSLVMENSTDISFVKDSNLRYVCCNKAFMNLLNVKTPGDMIGKMDAEIFPAAVAQEFRKTDSDLFITGIPQIDLKEYVPSRNGTYRCIRMSKQLLRDTSGAIIGIFGVGHDITEEQERLEQLQLITDNIPGGILTFRCKPDQIELAYYNDGLCRLSGYPRNEQFELRYKPTDIVFAEDMPIIKENLGILLNEHRSIECVFRIHTKGGGYKWVNVKAEPDEYIDGALIVNAVMIDVTALQEEKEQLARAEEEYRLVAKHSNRAILRYDVQARALTMSDEIAERYSLPKTVTDVPGGRIRLGFISPDTVDAYRAFYDKIAHGEKEVSTVFCKKLNNKWRWLSANATNIFDHSGKPVSAIISYTDITVQQEKEAVYVKWTNSLKSRATNTYTLFRCNLTKDTSFDTSEGTLLKIQFSDAAKTFNERTNEYAGQCVYPEDRAKYRAFLNSNTMLAEYYRNHRSDFMDFREIRAEGEFRWLRVTVELVEYPNSKEIEAYLMYEDIDESKRKEMRDRKLAETDALTGLLNRTAFAEKVNRVIGESKQGTVHAMLMFDIDNFKKVNDTFGHGAGDQTLLDIAQMLTKVTRKSDLVCRLGGDEFLIFLTDIHDKSLAEKKAKQICDLAHQSYSNEVMITVSIGIALYPQDGEGFGALYEMADKTQYKVKKTGKNNYGFVGDYADLIPVEQPQTESTYDETEEPAVKRRILVVDDSVIEHAIMENIFKKDYLVEDVMSGEAALEKLKQFGSAISVVLLDLMMPGIDGFEVLRQMQQNPQTSSVPVLIISGEDSREVALKVIKAGATDFISKPFDPEIIRVRVESAISKAENERLRARNSMLSMQNSEADSYKAVLEQSGIMVVTYDWLTHQFTYGASMQKRLSGHYDQRSLWQIFLTDLVTDTKSAQNARELIEEIAQHPEKTDGSITIRLKKNTGKLGLYTMNVFKELDNFGLSNKLIITFKEKDS